MPHNIPTPDRSGHPYRSLHQGQPFPACSLFFLLSSVPPPLKWFIGCRPKQTLSRHGKPGRELWILSFRGALATRNLRGYALLKISPYGRNDRINNYSKLSGPLCEFFIMVYIVKGKIKKQCLFRPQAIVQDSYCPQRYIDRRSRGCGQWKIHSWQIACYRKFSWPGSCPR